MFAIKLLEFTFFNIGEVLVDIMDVLNGRPKEFLHN